MSEEIDAKNISEDEQAQPEPHRLTKLYNIIDWIDFALIIAVVVYWVNPDRFYRVPNIGLIFGFVSLIVCISAVITAVMLYRKGINKSKIRLIIRFIIWGIWIPIDIFFIVQILGG